jgi:hypothetical protein
MSGQILFVCVDSDEDTYLMVANEEDVEAYYAEHPNADKFQCANAVARYLTDEEQESLPYEVEGTLAY